MSILFSAQQCFERYGSSLMMIVLVESVVLGGNSKQVAVLSCNSSLKLATIGCQFCPAHSGVLRRSLGSCLIMSVLAESSFWEGTPSKSLY
jgi:hypothetical protein